LAGQIGKLSDDSDDGLVKEAQPKRILTVPTPGSAPAPAPTPDKPAAPTAGRGVSISKAEHNAVAVMQEALKKLADVLDASEKATFDPAFSALLRETAGEKTKNIEGTSDGAWGPRTAKALNIAENYRKAWDKSVPSRAVKDEIRSYVPGGLMGRGKKTISEAKYNWNVIKRLTNAVRGIGPGATAGAKGQKYDTINGQDLYSSSLRSLAHLWVFVRKSELDKVFPWKQPESGLTYAQWEFLLDWFSKRAESYHSFTSDLKIRGVYQQYYRDIAKLKNGLVSMKDKVSPDEVLHVGPPVEPTADRKKEHRHPKQRVIPIGDGRYLVITEKDMYLAKGPNEKGGLDLVRRLSGSEKENLEGKGISLIGPEANKPPIHEKYIDLTREDIWDFEPRPRETIPYARFSNVRTARHAAELADFYFAKGGGGVHARTLQEFVRKLRTNLRPAALNWMDIVPTNIYRRNLKPLNRAMDMWSRVLYRVEKYITDWIAGEGR
jgi:hypothetical protein